MFPVLYRGLSAFDWPPLSKANAGSVGQSSLLSRVSCPSGLRSGPRSDRSSKDQGPAAAPRSTETCRAPASPPFVFCFRPSPKQELGSHPRCSLRVCCCCPGLRSPGRRGTAPSSARYEVLPTAAACSILPQLTPATCPDHLPSPPSKTRPTHL